MIVVLVKETEIELMLAIHFKYVQKNVFNS